MKYEVYLATCPLGKHYVGCTTRGVRARWGSFVPPPRSWPGDEKAGIEDAIKRFGRSAFRVELIAGAETAEIARWLETAVIERFNSVAPNGYNRDRRSNIPRKPYAGPHWRETKRLDSEAEAA